MSEAYGDFAVVVRSLLEYLKGKGQIWSASELASLLLVDGYFKRRYGLSLGLDAFVKAWVELSEIEAHRFKTVAQANVEAVTKISTVVNYVQEQGTRTRVLPLGRKRDKE